MSGLALNEALTFLLRNGAEISPSGDLDVTGTLDTTRIKPSGRLALTIPSILHHTLEPTVVTPVGEVAAPVTTPAPPIGTIGDDGWLVITDSADTQKVYVSWSTGNDTNPGTELLPVKTLSKGTSLLRWGKPDRLYLKRGDTWASSSGASWGTSGRSSTEPMVFSAYGTGARPIIQITSGHGLSYTGATAQHDIVIQSIHFQSAGPGNPRSSVRWLGPINRLLIEDCLCEGELTIQASTFGAIQNVCIRRCLVIDAWNTVKCQGIFCQKVRGLQLIENILDNNGYIDQSGGIYDSTIVNHNAYIQYDCAELFAQGNVSLRAPSHGLQARTGGTVDNNLFIDNAFGCVFSESSSAAPDAAGLVSRNVVLDGKDVPQQTTTLYRAWGIEITDTPSAHGVVVRDNIISGESSAATTPQGFSLSGEIDNVEVFQNIAQGWRRPLCINSAFGSELRSLSLHDNYFCPTDNDRPFIQYKDHASLQDYLTAERNVYFNPARDTDKYVYLFTSAAYKSFAQWVTLSGETGATTDPEITVPTIDDYMTHIAESGGLAEYATLLRGQSKLNWRDDLMPVEVNAWFREQSYPVDVVSEAGETIAAIYPGGAIITRAIFQFDAASEATLEISCNGVVLYSVDLDTTDLLIDNTLNLWLADQALEFRYSGELSEGTKRVALSLSPLAV